MAASLMTVRVLLMSLMIASILTASSSARLSHILLVGRERVANSMPHLTQREFGIEKFQLEYYRRREALMLNAGTMRVAPEGPDPQHHSKSPTLS
ncbi:Hypothetical predicted protein [Olea europaea subsp. europaea]|uniref:Uncharacterized protein n=1 Tax=Olea europaea subsp. europaea TaxID=158383 RepID=A0A8S0TKA0_OLEEU|nr:Hypothetical predicted protein [Olea europaea subsp. europaea]